MSFHPVRFSPSGRSTQVAEGATIWQAAQLAGEPLRAEWGGRGACGRCLARDLAGAAAIWQAAQLAGEPLRAECGGRGACGRCLVRILEGQVPEYRVLHRESGHPHALACLTPVHGPLTVQPLVEAQLPKLISGDRYAGMAPLKAWAPWPLDLDPIVASYEEGDLGVAVDIGTTTLRLLLIRLSDGVIVGEAGAEQPRRGAGADVIS